MRPFTALLLAWHLLGTATGDEHTHTYKDREEVVLWMNTVGPYHNRQETYSYFSLPFCVGPKSKISHYHETLGRLCKASNSSFLAWILISKSPDPHCPWCRNVSETIEHLLLQCPRFHDHRVVLRSQLLALNVATRDLPTLLASTPPGNTPSSASPVPS
ncbi:Transmembrane 9 superfamily member 3 [Chionoecetes opilio]|uniref:Transmembrane 9 superfamily member 3 n=1 Tax=Chionoecetes opilio TaxID=41210 RepID=A0A8J8W913_CHIOP|nr:Transmembrane 9 superfamily member 3 [Chionoecetes opilio]